MYNFLLIWLLIIGPLIKRENVFQTFNLFSLTKMQRSGWKLIGDDKAIMLVKNGVEIKFDIVIPTKEGAIFALYHRRDNPSAEMGQIMATKPVTMNIAQAHDKLGHLNEDSTRKVAKYMGWTITRGTLQVCEGCAAAKAKQKNVVKQSDHVASEVAGERVFLDISSIKQLQNGPKVHPKQHCRIIVDERTGMKFSEF